METEKNELWQTALAEIEVSISKANFLTWFKNTALISRKDGVVTVAVPNAFTKEWLENKYNQLVLRSLRNTAHDIKEVRFTIHSSIPSNSHEKRGRRVKMETAPLIEAQFNFAEADVDRETNLNPRYTFESFIVSSSNELAHAAALAVVQNVGTLYNPLFIYGGVGLGKTHLLQAIGNAVRAKESQKKVRYLTSERFTSEIIGAIRTKGIERVKEAYRWVDLLIIDDVQFLSGKEKTQEEFFHTFNALYEQNKQIVLSSDRPPRAIPTLEERLRSRFEGGMIADIAPPDYETRLAILKTKLADKKIEVELSEEILAHVATTITSNVRELEGALNRIVATARLAGSAPSLEKIKTLIAATPQPSKNKLTPKAIIRTVSEFYDIKEEELINQSRKREIVRPRQVCMYLIREELKSSYPFIGERFGGRDHTTVMHAVSKITREVQQSEGFAEEINLIKGRLYV
jgi:chromosomal replication initiator protein